MGRSRPVLNDSTLIYRAFTLDIETEFPIPVFGRPGDGGSSIDLRIHRGEINVSTDSHVFSSRSGVVLRTPAGTLQVSDGQRILVDPRDEVSRIEPYLVGPAFGTILYQRTVLPLHGCLIEIEDSAVAFLGHSGAGKSTLAVAFYKEGYDIGSDDIVPVVRSDGRWDTLPTFPAVKLDPSGPFPSIGSASWSTVDLDKRFNLIQEGFMGQRYPLERVYVLDSGPSVELSSVSTQRAFREVLRHSYRPYLVEEIGIEHPHLELCSGVAAEVSVKRLSRPLTPDVLAEIIEIVERDLENE